MFHGEENGVLTHQGHFITRHTLQKLANNDEFPVPVRLFYISSVMLFKNKNPAGFSEGV